MKDRSRRHVKGSARAPLKRRNPIARALIERALGERVLGGKRYTRKVKHPKRLDPGRD